MWYNIPFMITWMIHTYLNFVGVLVFFVIFFAYFFDREELRLEEDLKERVVFQVFASEAVDSWLLGASWMVVCEQAIVAGLCLSLTWMQLECEN